MKKLLIIYPHYPPSNLTGVHRPRLIAAHLPKLGWEPIILTVDEKYYEEALDMDLVQLLPTNQRIVKVSASKRIGPIGDIGIRAFDNLYKRAVELIKQERIDFVWIPIPSFYVALLGPKIYKATGVKYGIDYIDPWVHTFPGSEKVFSKAWLSTKLAKLLEPRAVKYASLLTGVAEGYYTDVFKRNPSIKGIAYGAMPYGAEQLDFNPELLANRSLVWKSDGKMHMVYAGALLPKAFPVLDAMLNAIAENMEIFNNINFYFLGTGNNSISGKNYTVKPYAEKYGLWEKLVFEFPDRLNYLDVLAHLHAANGILILGSTEAHYTPSKVFQSIQSGKPIFAILHKDSTAIHIIDRMRAGIVSKISTPENLASWAASFPEVFSSYIQFAKGYNGDQLDYKLLEPYTAKASAATLVQLLNKVCDEK